MSRPLPLRLAKGAHRHGSPGLCLVEAADVHAGGPGSDQSGHVSSSLAAYCRAVNDALREPQRQRLIPLIPLLVTTGDASIEVEVARAFFLVDASIRRIMPIWMEAIGFEQDAAKLRALRPIRTASDAARADRVDLVDRAALADLADLAGLAARAALAARVDLAGLADLAARVALAARVDLADLAARVDLAEERATTEIIKVIEEACAITSTGAAS